MHRFMGLALGSALMVMVVTPAMAAVDAAGAEQLKKDIEGSLAFHKELRRLNNEGLDIGGDISVEPKGGYYVVTFPNVSMVVQRGAKATFGNIVANAAPSDGGSYVISMRLPDIALQDETGRKLADVSIGKQKFSAVWRPDLDIFPVVDVNYADINVKPQLEAGDEFSSFVMTVDGLRGLVKLSENADGTWSGPQSFELKNLAVDARSSKNPAAYLKLDLEKITSLTTYDGMKVGQIKDAKRKFMEAAANPDSLSAEQQADLVRNMMEGMGGFAREIDTKFVLSGLSVDSVPVKEPEKPFNFALSSLDMGFMGKDNEGEKGSVGLTLGMQGLAVDKMSPETAGLVPSELNFDILIEHLPLKELGDALTQTLTSALTAASLPEGAGSPSDPQKMQEVQNVKMQAMMTMATLPQLLANAGSKLTVSKTFVNATDIAATLDGAFTASASSPMMATGDITLVMTGLDELIQKLQGMAQQPGASPRAAGIAQALAFLQMSGQPGQGADGKSQRSYKLEVTPEGKATLNGADIGMMMGGMGAPMGGQPMDQPALSAP